MSQSPAHSKTVTSFTKTPINFLKVWSSPASPSERTSRISTCVKNSPRPPSSWKRPSRRLVQKTFSAKTSSDLASILKSTSTVEPPPIFVVKKPASSSRSKANVPTHASSPRISPPRSAFIWLRPSSTTSSRSATSNTSSRWVAMNMPNSACPATQAPASSASQVISKIQATTKCRSEKSPWVNFSTTFAAVPKTDAPSKRSSPEDHPQRSFAATKHSKSAKATTKKRSPSGTSPWISTPSPSADRWPAPAESSSWTTPEKSPGSSITSTTSTPKNPAGSAPLAAKARCG